MLTHDGKLSLLTTAFTLGFCSQCHEQKVNEEQTTQSLVHFSRYMSVVYHVVTSQLEELGNPESLSLWTFGMRMGKRMAIRTIEEDHQPSETEIIVVEVFQTIDEILLKDNPVERWAYVCHTLFVQDPINRTKLEAIVNTHFPEGLSDEERRVVDELVADIRASAFKLQYKNVDDTLKAFKKKLGERFTRQ